MAAIYQWWQDGVSYTLLTTTLYPIEIVEGMAIGIALTYGGMWPLPVDEMEGVFSFLSGTLDEILIEAPIEQDEMEGIFSFLSGTLIQILIEAPIEQDEMEGIFSFLQGTLDQILVETYIEDSGLLLTCGPKPSLCSMTPI